MSRKANDKKDASRLSKIMPHAEYTLHQDPGVRPHPRTIASLSHALVFVHIPTAPEGVRN